MLLKERTYRLPAALLLLMAAFAVTLHASVAQASNPNGYYIDFVDDPSSGTNVTVSGAAGTTGGGNFSNLEIEFTGSITGSVSVLSSGLFSGTMDVDPGHAEAILKHNGVEIDRLDVYPF